MKCFPSTLIKLTVIFTLSSLSASLAISSAFSFPNIPTCSGVQIKCTEIPICLNLYKRTNISFKLPPRQDCKVRKLEGMPLSRSSLLLYLVTLPPPIQVPSV